MSDRLTEELYQKALVAEDKRRLVDAKAERKRLVAQYGNQGQQHPMGRMIGGLNPAALRLHSVRGDIRSLENKLRPKKERPQTSPLSSARKKGDGLKLAFSYKGHSAKLGIDNHGVWYAVINGTDLIELHERTPSKARDALANIFDKR